MEPILCEINFQNMDLICVSIPQCETFNVCNSKFMDQLFVKQFWHTPLKFGDLKPENLFAGSHCFINYNMQLIISHYFCIFIMIHQSTKKFPAF